MSEHNARIGGTVSADRHELVRRANVELVFREIGQRAPVSRRELVRTTGLSKPTVLSVVAALEDEGFIRAVDVASANRPSGRLAGRIPTAYEPNPQAAYVVGVDLGGTKVAVALADLGGAVLAETAEPTTSDGGIAVVAQIAELVRRLVKQAGVSAKRVDAISVGTPGVENRDGTIRLAENVPGLDTVKVASQLRRTLRTTVLVDNDVNLAALGELEAGVARSCRNFALLAIGTGVGLGLVIDGRLATGARGAAGELAYLPIGPEPDTDRARRRGAFELAASGSGLLTLVADELALVDGPRPSSQLGPGSSPRDVYAAASAGDIVAGRIVERHAELVARAVLAVAAIVDPELVVLGGGIGANPVLIDPVRRAVERITPWSVRIESSTLGTRAGVLGAVHQARRSVPAIESARVSARIQSAGTQ